MGRIGGARGAGLGQERVQALPTHGPTPALAAYPVPILARGDLQATGAIAPIVVPEGLD